MVKKVKRWARKIAFRSFVSLVRGGDALGGPWLLALLFVPLGACQVVVQRRHYALFSRLRGVLPPAFWQSHPLRHYHRMLRGWQESQATALLYDRLLAARWQRRLTFTGTPPDRLAEWKQRPVILCCLHTGGFGVLRYWLRARGIPAATLLWILPELLASYGSPTRKAGDARYELAAVPHYFSYQDGLRPVLRFLKPGRLLGMALDGRAVKNAPLPYAVGDGVLLHLNDGAARLARLNHAVLLPVSVHRQGAFRFEFRFGAPVPEALVQAEDLSAAMQDLAGQLWAELKTDPMAFGLTSLKALAPEAADGAVLWP